MNCWQVLGIDITTDKKIIKKAYAKVLKKHHPEEDPEGFSRVRIAYEQALAYCKAYEKRIVSQQPHKSAESKSIEKRNVEGKLEIEQKSYGINHGGEKSEREQKPYYISDKKEKTEEKTKREQKPYYIDNKEEKTEDNKQKSYGIYDKKEKTKRQQTPYYSNQQIDAKAWLLKVETLYKDFNRRIQVQYWKVLVSQILYFSVEEMAYIRNGMIDFLNQHYYMPYDVWYVLDEKFRLSEVGCKDSQVAHRSLCIASLKFLMNRIPLSYTHFSEFENVDYDEVIKLYYEAYMLVEEGNCEEALERLDKIGEKNVWYGEFDILRVKCYLHQNNLDKARLSVIYLEPKYKRYFEKHIHTLEQVDENTFTMARARSLARACGDAPLLFKLGEYYTKHKYYDEAMKCYDVILTISNKDRRAYEKKIEVCLKLYKINEVATCYEHLSSLYPEKKDYKEKLEIYKEKLKKSVPSENIPNIANTILGENYANWLGEKLGEYDSAIARNRVILLVGMTLISIYSINIVEAFTLSHIIQLGTVLFIAMSMNWGWKGINYFITGVAVIGVGIILVVNGPMDTQPISEHMILGLWNFVLWFVFMKWGSLYKSKKIDSAYKSSKINVEAVEDKFKFKC